MMVVGRGGETGPPLPPSLSAQLGRDEPHGRLAQLGRAAALHAVGQGFESLVAHSPCSPFSLPLQAAIVWLALPLVFSLHLSLMRLLLAAPDPSGRSLPASANKQPGLLSLQLSRAALLAGREELLACYIVR